MSAQKSASAPAIAAITLASAVAFTTPGTAEASIASRHRRAATSVLPRSAASLRTDAECTIHKRRQ